MLKSLLKWIKEHITVGAVKTPYGDGCAGFKFTIKEELPPEGSQDRD